MKMKKTPRCDICGKSFSRRDNLERHKASHLSRPVYYCDVCQKGFSRKSYLKVHGRSHTGEKPYICGICSCAFARDDHLVRHRRKQHTDKIFDNIISSIANMPLSTGNDVNNSSCSTNTNTNANNNTIAITNNNNSNSNGSSSSSRSSSSCNNISSQVSDVLSEQQQQQLQQQQQQKSCQSYIQQTQNERCIISNAFPVLSGENQINYICAIKKDEDSKKLTTSDLLQIQQELQHQQQQQQQQQLLLLQQQLQLQQSEMQQFQPHLVLKQDIDDDDEAVEDATAATAVAPTASAIAPHATTVVPSTMDLSMTDADNCVQTLATDGTNIMNIVKILPAVVSTSCSGCYLDASAVDSSNICWKQEDNCPGIIATYALPVSSSKPPQKTIGCNAVPFHCTVCSKTFSRRDNLERHKLCHQEGVNKQYSCDICDKAFSRKSYLKVHARIHSGERPYQCDLCGFAFSRYDHLLKHKRPTKGRRKLSCVPRANVMAAVMNNTTDAPATEETPIAEVHYQNDLQQIQLSQQQQLSQQPQLNIIQDASIASGLTTIDSQAQLTEGHAVFHTNTGAAATAMIPQQAMLGAHTVTLANTPITQIFHTIQMSSTAQIFPTLQMTPATHLFTNNLQLANTARIFTNKLT